MPSERQLCCPQLPHGAQRRRTAGLQVIGLAVSTQSRNTGLGKAEVQERGVTPTSGRPVGLSAGVAISMPALFSAPQLIGDPFVEVIERMAGLGNEFDVFLNLGSLKFLIPVRNATLFGL